MHKAIEIEKYQSFIKKSHKVLVQCSPQFPNIKLPKEYKSESHSTVAQTTGFMVIIQKHVLNNTIQRRSFLSYSPHTIMQKIKFDNLYYKYIKIHSLYDLVNIRPFVGTGVNRNII